MVLWALNKNPADRPADADQFITALEQVKEGIVSGARGQMTASMAAVALVGPGGEVPATAVAPGAVSDTSPPMVGAFVDQGQPPPPDEYSTPAQRPRRRWPWIVALLVLLLAGGGVAAYLLTRPVKKIVPVVVREQVVWLRPRFRTPALRRT